MLLKLRPYIIKRIGKINFLVLLFAVFIILHNEHLCYKIARRRWINFSHSMSKDMTVRIMFVSDPQLVGFNDEHWFFGFVTRWDCDRYLYKGFNEALDHADPAAVVYLGDLFDEGGVATDSQYEIYIERFNQIFQIPSHIKVVYAPGDNDITGENFIQHNSFITHDKIKRFDNYFPAFAKPVTNISFVDIMKQFTVQTLNCNNSQRGRILNSIRNKENRASCHQSFSHVTMYLGDIYQGTK